MFLLAKHRDKLIHNAACHLRVDVFHMLAHKSLFDLVEGYAAKFFHQRRDGDLKGGATRKSAPDWDIRVDNCIEWETLAPFDRRGITPDVGRPLTFSAGATSEDKINSAVEFILLEKIVAVSPEDGPAAMIV